MHGTVSDRGPEVFECFVRFADTLILVWSIPGLPTMVRAFDVVGSALNVVDGFRRRRQQA
ncbi:hypothetical protein JOE65_001577 [Arthrobacter roseus]|nr:hypothetical protein [Arthrobacter roseus]